MIDWAPIPAGPFPFGISAFCAWAGGQLPTEEEPPGERVLRGGSFASPGLAWARCTMRGHSRPGRRQSHIGFRAARACA